MGIRHRIEDQIKSWPVYRQLSGTDRLGRGEAAKSRASGRLSPGRAISALSGASLLAASAATRWGVFHAGLASARDPKYTVVPQRERREARGRERARTPERAAS